jgi:drug/metabolite transporter superfamily protein YnfA
VKKSPFSSAKTGEMLLFGTLVVATTLYLVLMVDPLGANWRWDDTQILLAIHQQPILDYFFAPEIWRAFTPANLTPWLLVSYQIDLALFGMMPTFFYFHQIGALAAVMGLLYVLLRQWTGRSYALMGCLLFIAGAPISHVSQQLMTRHYIEGAVFALAALILYVRYLRRPRISLLLASLLAYGLAMTAKEIYVPLVLGLLFIPESNWNSRIRASLPFWLLALAYSAWRAYMLGSLSGGYGVAGEEGAVELLSGVALGLLAIPQLLTGPFSLLFWTIVGGLAVGYGLKNPAHLPFMIVVVACVMGPLLPLTESPGIHAPDRYLFLVWLTLSIAIVIFCSGVLRGRQGTVLHKVAVPSAALILLSLLLANAWTERSKVFAIAKEFDAHAELLWNNANAIAYIPSDAILTSFWFAQGLEALKTQYRPEEGIQLAIIDPLFLHQVSGSISALLVYNGDCRCFMDDSDSLVSRMQDFQSKYRPDATLSLDYSYVDRIFSWSAGPYRQGQWHFLSKELGGLAEVPSRGQLRVSLADGGILYLRYTSPDGWITYSEGLEINHPLASTEWRR